QLHFSVKTDFVSFCVRNILEEYFSFGIDGNTFCEAVVFTNQFPSLSVDENVSEKGILCLSCNNWFWVIAPQPPHSFGKDSRSVPVIVSPRSPHMVYVVAGKRERAFHRFISLPPIACVDVEVVRTILHKDADWFWFVFPD